MQFFTGNRFNPKIVIISLIILSGLIIISSVITAGNFGPGSTPAQGELKNINLDLHFIQEQKLVSLRQLSEKLDLVLFYFSQEKVVSIYNGFDNVELKIDGREFNGHTLENPPLIINGKTYISPSLVTLLLQELEINNRPDLITDLTIAKSNMEPGTEMKVTIEAINISDAKLDLRFNSGQRYDLYLMKEDKKVWEWSEGKFFTMVLKDKSLKSGELVTYEVKMELPSGLEPGNYILSGEISTFKPLQLGKVEMKIG